MDKLTDFYAANPTLAVSLAATAVAGAALVARAALSGPKPFQLASEAVELPLIRRTVVNHNVRIFRFGLPNKDDTLGLPPGQHISLSAMTASSAETGRRTCVPAVFCRPAPRWP